MQTSLYMGRPRNQFSAFRQRALTTILGRVLIFNWTNQKGKVADPILLEVSVIIWILDLFPLLYNVRWISKARFWIRLLLRPDYKLLRLFKVFIMLCLWLLIEIYHWWGKKQPYEYIIDSTTASLILSLSPPHRYLRLLYCRKHKQYSEFYLVLCAARWSKIWYYKLAIKCIFLTPDFSSLLYNVVSLVELNKEKMVRLNKWISHFVKTYFSCENWKAFNRSLLQLHFSLFFDIMKKCKNFFNEWILNTCSIVVIMWLKQAMQNEP